MFKRQDFVWKLINMSNFQPLEVVGRGSETQKPLEVVGRGSETQLQVCENVSDLICRFNG